PSYARIAAKKIEDGGEVAALRGTSALITARLTGQAKAARIVLRDGRKIEMRGDGAANFHAAVSVTGNTSYYVELTSLEGETYRGSNEYDITMLEDQPPTVSFEKPGRDARATSVEEVFTQARAEDDYGVAALEMYFSVNGGAEQKVDLQKLTRDAARALSGVHTFFLEEYGLKPGDVVSYYAKARDAHAEVSSDIYFIEIKPFDMQYKQAQQQGGGGGEGGGSEQQNALTRRQKELIAATFRLVREGAGTNPKERADNYNVVALGQEKLRNDARDFIERVKRRLGEGGEGAEELARMIEYITQATREMEGALTPLKGQSGRDALPAEQRALQQLLRADAVFREMQVASGNQQGGGGGGQQESKELSDLFELELDKMKNQYETLRREGRQSPQQQAQQGKSEAERKLEELARRQQQALAEQQRRVQNQSGQSGPLGQSGQSRNGGEQRQQQELIEETRRTARELERLSRERRDPRMQELSRQLNQAADDMQRAQSASQNSDQGEAVAQGRRALDRLEQARRRMQSASQSSRGQEVSELRQRAAEAAARQREITKDVEALARRGAQGRDEANARSAKQQLGERKEALADALNNLEQDLEQAARAQGEQPGKGRTSQQLRDAAATLERNRTAERIKGNQQNIDNDQYEAARAGERAVQQSLNEVAERLQSAEQNAGHAPGSEGEEALEQTRQLADNLESLRRRLGENSKQRDGQQQAGQQRGQQQGPRQAGQQSGQQSGQQRSPQQQGQQSGQKSDQQSGEQSGQQSGQQSGRSGDGQSGGERVSSGSVNGEYQGWYRKGRISGGGAAGAEGQGNPVDERLDQRQTAAELRERLREAEELRRQLGRNGGEAARDLNKAIEVLKQMASGVGGMQGDPQTGALLKAQVIDPLRQVELELSRRLQAATGQNNLRLRDEGTAPERYRKSVDEYYKRLSSRGLR
nr:hypothetical protein [Pyrinomonadaceae bacterium]